MQIKIKRHEKFSKLQIVVQIAVQVIAPTIIRVSAQFK